MTSLAAMPEDVAKRLLEEKYFCIYCGAGVTQDRTGLSWSELNRQLIISAKDEAIAYLAAQLQRLPSHEKLKGDARREVNKLEEELEEQLKKWGSSLAYFYNDPSISQQKKSTATLGIVKSGTAYLKNLNEEDALSEGLHRYQALVSDILYRYSGWSTGRLLEQIVSLALLLAYQGKKIVVVTSNYDVYIEEAFVEYLRRIRKMVSPGALAGARVRYFTYQGSKKSAAQDAYKDTDFKKNSGADIEIHYIHGRLSRDSSRIEGDLILSEESYAQSVSFTEKIISDQFKKGSALICGASLDDLPLVNALIECRENSDQTYRYALVSDREWGNGGREFANIVEYARASELGIKPLIFRSYAEASDIVADISTLFLKGSSVDVKISANLQTTQEVFRRWCPSSEAEESGGIVHEMLRQILDDALKPIIQKHVAVDVDVAHETFKLELWLFERIVYESRELAALRVYGNTLGPIFDIGSSRFELLRDSGGRVNSVDAFLRGAPKLEALENLNRGQFTHRASRWRTYLSVPFSINDPEQFYTPNIGVLTLTSTRPGFLVETTDFFADDAATIRQSSEDEPVSALWQVSRQGLEHLSHVMLACGELLLHKMLGGSVNQ